MGSTSIVMDASGQIVEKGDYMPWGGERGDEGITTTDYGYTGQMKEDDIYYYNARWYDPAIGRFMQADTIVPLQVQGTQAFDRYAYVNNNPLRYTDPSGNIAITGAILIGVASGALVGYAGQVIHNLSNDMSFKEALTTDISAGWIIGGAVAGGALGGIGFAALSHFGIINSAATATTTATSLCADGDCTNEAVSVITSVTADGDPTNEIQTAGEGIRQVGYTVYRYVEDGVSRYFGMTNDFGRRANEHFISRGWRIEMIEGLTDIPRSVARGAEQVLIETYGLNNLYNKINSIALHNPIYKAATQQGRELLETLNFIK